MRNMMLAVVLLLSVACVSPPQINSPVEGIAFAYIQISETAKQVELARLSKSITGLQALRIKNRLQTAVDSVSQAEGLMCIITVSTGCIVDQTGAQSKISSALSITQLIKKEVSQ